MDTIQNTMFHFLFVVTWIVLVSSNLMFRGSLSRPSEFLLARRAKRIRSVLSSIDFRLMVVGATELENDFPEAEREVCFTD